MALNPDAVGTVGEPYKVSWASKDSLLYAVSLNIGTDQLEYVTENTNGVTQKTLPTFPFFILLAFFLFFQDFTFICYFVSFCLFFNNSSSNVLIGIGSLFP